MKKGLGTKILLNDCSFQITAEVITAVKITTIQIIRAMVAVTVLIKALVVTAVVLAAVTITKAVITVAITPRGTNKTIPTVVGITIADLEQILDQITTEMTEPTRDRIIDKGGRGPQGPTGMVMYKIANLLIEVKYLLSGIIKLLKNFVKNATTKK